MAVAPARPAAERAALLLPAGPDWYAVPLVTVEEVVEAARISRLPAGPTAALGVMNVRGRVVPVFDLGLLLGLRPMTRVGAIAVLGTARGPAGLATDGVPVADRLVESLGRSDLSVGVARWRVGVGVATEVDLEAALAPERLSA